MNLGKLGVWCSLDLLAASEAMDAARRIESLGYTALWCPEAVSREAFANSAMLLAATKSLIVATGIANIYARDAMTMAAGRSTLAEMSGGRFLLGIGVSHRPLVQGIRKHDWSKPFSYMKEYLAAMESAPYAAYPPAEPAPTVVGALHPKMLALAAEKTQGAHPYLMPPEHTAFARRTMGPKAWLCPEQKVLLETDATKARATARAAIAMYLGLPNYCTSLERMGFGQSDFASGGSDRLVDAIVAWGDEAALTARIRAHYDAGADHVCIQPLHPDGLPILDWRVLEALAPSKG